MLKRFEASTGEIDVKRFYLPINITTDCPHCRKTNEKDFYEDYLSYPSLGEPIEVWQYCEHCEEEYNFKVTLTAQLTFDAESITKE